jgi:hypothetical protein
MAKFGREELSIKTPLKLEMVRLRSALRAGLAWVNALFQKNPDPFAPFCGSMKILGLEKFFMLRSQKTKIFGKNQPLEKNNLFKKQGDFLDLYMMRT